MRPTIKCPYCGAEYLPSEIFMPETLLDKSAIINKDSNGKIENVKGEEAELRESYICDYCDKEFVVYASIMYNTSKEDIEEDYVTKL